ncbi:MAG: hypothetical protein CW342_08585 [Thermoactinomycetaceae bacterium]|jgi:hypothetical protein|nr:hypothetical protein [Thermoactinomycetaceae bacterium]
MARRWAKVMKQRVLALVSCFFISLAAACAPAGQRPETDTDQTLFRDRTGGTPGVYDYVNREAPRGIRMDTQNPVGYIRYRRDNNRNGNRAPNIYVDRNVLARQIAYLVTNQRGIRDATVLVTDDHVFIGLNDVQGKALDSRTLRRIRQTALSVTPRYYRVRIVNDSSLLRRMNEVGTGRARGDLQRLLRDLGDTTLPGVGTPGIIRRPGQPAALD